MDTNNANFKTDYRQYYSCKNLQKLNTSSVQKNANINTKPKMLTMTNLQIQVGVVETIILCIKTKTKGPQSLLQVAKT